MSKKLDARYYNENETFLKIPFSHCRLRNISEQEVNDENWVRCLHELGYFPPKPNDEIHTD